MKSNAVVQPQQAAQGQILVEVMLALALFLLVAGSLVRLRLGWWQQTQQMQLREGARALAVSKLEDLAAFQHIRDDAGQPSYAGISTDQGGLLPAGHQPGSPYRLHWQVTDHPSWPEWDIPASKQVIVDVRWQEGRTEASWRLSHLLLPLPVMSP